MANIFKNITFMVPTLSSKDLKVAEFLKKKEEVTRSHQAENDCMLNTCALGLHSGSYSAAQEVQECSAL